MHHRVRYAVALAKNTDSLLKGMILFDQGGGGEGDWGKYHGGNHSPPSVRGPPVFLLLLARRIFLYFCGLKNIGGKLTCWTPYFCRMTQLALGMEIASPMIFESQFTVS